MKENYFADFMSGALGCSDERGVEASIVEALFEGGDCEVATDFYTLCDQLQIPEESRGVARQTLALELARQGNLSIFGNVELMSETYGANAVQLEGIGEFDLGSNESFNPLADKTVGYENLIRISLSKWANDGVLKAFQNVSCKEPVLKFEPARTTVRKLAGAPSSAVTALDTVRDPSILEEAKPTLEPDSGNAGIDTDGVFPNTEIADLGAVCNTFGEAAVVDHTDMLDPNILLEKVHVTFTWDDAGTPTDVAGVITIPSAQGRFGQITNNKTAARAILASIPRTLDNAAIEAFTGGAAMYDALFSDDAQKIYLSVDPAIIVNTQTRSYNPQGKVTFTLSDDTNVAKLTAITVTGYEIDMCYLQDNMRRNTLLVDIEPDSKEYAIPQGTVVVQSRSITNPTAGRMPIEIMSGMSLTAADNRALASIRNTLTNVSTMVAEYEAAPTLVDDPAINYAASGKSRPCVILDTMDMTDLVAQDHSRQIDSINAFVTLRFQGIIAEIESKSLFKTQLKPGEKVVWTAFCSGEVASSVMLLAGEKASNGVTKLPDGTEIAVKVLANTNIANDIMLVPVVMGGEEASVLSAGIVGDCGTGVYEYQGGTNGAVTKGTAVVARRAWVPTNGVGAIVSVTSLSEVTFRA